MTLWEKLQKKKYCKTCEQVLDEHNKVEFADGYYCRECAKERKKQQK